MTALEKGGQKKRRFSSLLAAISHLGGQLFGVALALLVSHLIARRLGIGSEADAFFFGRRIATSLIETLNQVMGVFYIPLVAAHAISSGRGFLRVTLRYAVIAAFIGLGLTAIIALGSTDIVRLLAPDYGDEAATLARQILTLFSAALPATMACIVFAAFLNVTGRFGMPSTIRQLPRAAIAVTLVLATANIALQGAGAFAVAWFAVCAIMLWQCLRIGLDWQPGPSTEAPAVRPVATGIAAVLLVVAALASTWLETAYAARIGTGGVTQLELTQRLGTLLGNTLVMSLSLVVFTGWSRRVVAGEVPTASDFWRNIVIGLAALLPVQIYIAMHSETLVSFLLGYGEFDAAAVQSVADSVRWMTMAPISAFVLRMILVRVLADPRLPVVRLVATGAVFDTVLKAILFEIMTPMYGVVGIVTAQAISPLVTTALFFVLLRRRGLLSGGVRLGREMGLALAAIIAVIGFGLGAMPFMGQENSMGVDLAMLACSGLAGIALFLTTAKVFRVPLTLY